MASVIDAPARCTDRHGSFVTSVCASAAAESLKTAAPTIAHAAPAAMSGTTIAGPMSARGLRTTAMAPTKAMASAPSTRSIRTDAADSESRTSCFARLYAR